MSVTVTFIVDSFEQLREEMSSFMLGAPVATHTLPPVQHAAPFPALQETSTAPATIETPATPVQAVPAPVAGVDSRGLPWDARIHSANGAKNGDGSWRKRRGVEDALVNAVEAELRSVVPSMSSAPAQPVVPSAPEYDPAAFFGTPAAPAQPVVPSMPSAPAQPVVPSMPSAPAQPVVPSMPSAPAAIPVPQDFGQFMSAVSHLMRSGVIDQGYMTQFVTELQVPAITAIAANPDKLRQAVQILQRDGKL